MYAHGRVWKPRVDGYWHWQLVIRESHRQARVYSGHQPEWSVAMAEMRLQYTLHSVPGVGQTPFVVLGVDNPMVA
jgi:hypothetical protein